MPEAAGAGGAWHEPDRYQVTGILSSPILRGITSAVEAEVELSDSVFVARLPVLFWYFHVDRSDGPCVEVRAPDIDRHHSEVPASRLALVRGAEGTNDPKRFERRRRCEQVKAVIEL